MIPTTVSSAINPLEILKTLGIANPAKVTTVTGGADSAIWRVENSDGKIYALRLLRPAQLNEARREVAVMEAVRQKKIAIPRVLAQSVWQERPVLLLEWCDGRTLIAEIQSRIGRIWRLGVLFGQTQAAIHQVIAPVELTQNGDDWLAMVGTANPRLQAALATFNLRPDRVLHLDYHPLNVLIDGKRITGVIDWANAAAGDPRFDFARTVTLLRLAPASTNIPGPILTVFRSVLEYGWRAGYKQIAGPVHDLALFYVWAGLAMEYDLAPKLGQRADLKIQDIERVRLWTQKWQQKAGI